MEVAINFGSILAAAFIFYFVIKWAVKAGINESMLFTDAQRKKQNDEEIEEFNNAINGINKK